VSAPETEAIGEITAALGTAGSEPAPGS
jgi:hypothetical protein